MYTRSLCTSLVEMAGEGQTGGGAITQRAGNSGGARPAGSGGTMARRAAATRRPAAKASGGGGGGAGILRFYNDDSPGLQIGPTTVLVMSLLFIAFVVLLHIWGKFNKG